MQRNRWAKLGVSIFVASDSSGWRRSRAYVPTPILLDEDTIRVYVAFLDADNVGRVGYVDLDSRDPTRIRKVSSNPVLDVGDPGMFDDCGVAAVCVLPVGRELWMYYIGFQRSLRVPYHIFTGLATSRDRGETFHRVKRVPILDRTDFGALLRSSPFVMPPEGTSSVWRMWYSAGSSPRSATTGWVPSYSLYYAESPNGIDWTGPDTPILSPTGAGEYGLGKPWVRRLDTGLEMFYSVRSEPLGYRIGYATMVDGQTWVRRDEAAEIDVSPSGWDSDMIAFPALCASQSGTYMFYNGNGIGMTGFGAALEVLQP